MGQGTVARPLVELIYPFAGPALARRLELAEARFVAELTGVFPSGEALSIAGGIACFGGAGSPMSHAIAAGTAGPISEADFEQLEQFYLTRGTAPTIDLCPLADPTLNEALGKRGYRITEFNNVLIRPISSSFAYEHPAVSRAENRSAWARTVATGFFDRDEFTGEEIEMMSVLFDTASGVPWIAAIDGEPAAGAGMSIQDRVAFLFGDSTIRRFRKRGLHAALIQVRLAYAAANGCDLATAATVPGTQSQSNYERLGFRVAYTKLIMTR